jgi:hypothetical protein
MSWDALNLSHAVRSPYLDSREPAGSAIPDSDRPILYLGPEPISFFTLRNTCRVMNNEDVGLEVKLSYRWLLPHHTHCSHQRYLTPKSQMSRLIVQIFNSRRQICQECKVICEPLPRNDEAMENSDLKAHIQFIYSCLLTLCTHLSARFWFPRTRRLQLCGVKCTCHPSQPSRVALVAEKASGNSLALGVSKYYVYHLNPVIPSIPLVHEEDFFPAPENTLSP